MNCNCCINDAGNYSYVFIVFKDIESKWEKEETLTQRLWEKPLSTKNSCWHENTHTSVLIYKAYSSGKF